MRRRASSGAREEQWGREEERGLEQWRKGEETAEEVEWMSNSETVPRHCEAGAATVAAAAAACAGAAVAAVALAS